MGHLECVPYSYIDNDFILGCRGGAGGSSRQLHCCGGGNIHIYGTSDKSMLRTNIQWILGEEIMVIFWLGTSVTKKHRHETPTYDSRDNKSNLYSTKKYYYQHSVAKQYSLKFGCFINTCLQKSRSCLIGSLWLLWQATSTTLNMYVIHTIF